MLIFLYKTTDMLCSYFHEEDCMASGYRDINIHQPVSAILFQLFTIHQMNGKKTDRLLAVSDNQMNVYHFKCCLQIICLID